MQYSNLLTFNATSIMFYNLTTISQGKAYMKNLTFSLQILSIDLLAGITKKNII